MNTLIYTIFPHRWPAICVFHSPSCSQHTYLLCSLYQHHSIKCTTHPPLLLPYQNPISKHVKCSPFTKYVSELIKYRIHSSSFQLGPICTTNGLKNTRIGQPTHKLTLTFTRGQLKLQFKGSRHNLIVEWRRQR